MYFFSAPIRKNLNGLFQHVYLLASLELVVTSDSNFGNPDDYEKVSELIDRCIEELYKELKFPA